METRRTEARVAAMMSAHGEALRRVARRYSLTADDADDAVQRGLEIYLRRLGRVDPATEAAWLKVVVKHEALAVRRARADAVAGEDVDLDAHPAPDQRPLEDLLAGRERAGRVAEALRRLKPDEARALLLKADGLSYEEIGRRMGWTYTKVNRCLTEGRKRFFEVYEEIEAGEACARVAPALASLARGRAGAEALLELRPHLRNCASCRAAVRGVHARRRGRLAALGAAAAVCLAGAGHAAGCGAAAVEPTAATPRVSATPVGQARGRGPRSPEFGFEVAAPADAPPRRATAQTGELGFERADPAPKRRRRSSRPAE
jgi:RNA polymerase sigma factor (sigma-70 family)